METRRIIEGRHIRFTDFFDDESIEFERQLGVELPLTQTSTYLKYSPREFLLLQTRTPTGEPALQAVVYLGRSSVFGGFAMGSVAKMGPARNEGLEEEFGIRVLRRLCAEIPGLMTLRLQPERLNHRELMNFQSRASRQGFHLEDPINITRTLLWDLGGSEEERYQRLHGKTRAKLRHRGRELVELRAITDTRYIPRCREATDVSRGKTGGSKTSYDFDAAFALAKNHPNRARVIGLFMKARPDELLSYVIGFRRGRMLEYSSAGAFHDPELRALPFNYFLLWELAKWGADLGCQVMDLGGVTDGCETDPLQGISRFKRTLTEEELEIGREMVAVLKPARFWIYSCLTRLRDVVSARMRHSALFLSRVAEK